VTLRLRLSLTLVAVVAIGLIVSDVVTYSSLRSFLARRVDQQLQTALNPTLHLLVSSDPNDARGLTPGTYAELFNSSGQSIRHFAVPYGGSTLARPVWPSSIGSLGSPAGPFTVGALGDPGLHYRVVAAGLDGGFVLVAIPLTEMKQTLSRLEWIAGLVTLAVLAAMAVLSWFAVRRELRPLERVEQTAGAIAGGDLSRRVDQGDPHTEVGRLGIALNTMLSRIEAAMDERRASEEALRRFLADASHELRTPLTSIRGYAELFRRGADASPQDTALAMRRIEQESERMGALVDDLLFLERAGRGRPLTREPVDLAGVVTDAVYDARAADRSRQIELDSPSQLIVVGDEGRLRQVFANLLSNAREHTPAGTAVNVQVRTESDWAVVIVEDRGPGIGPENLPHIFEPFYRVDPSRGRSGGEVKQEGSGTGLGLAIVAAVAVAHGGRIEVKSAPGEGTTFTFRIPVAGGPASPGLDSDRGVDHKPAAAKDPGLFPTHLG
jgi:two-component system, OmpR family, sensor kinase